MKNKHFFGSLAGLALAAAIALVPALTLAEDSKAVRLTPPGLEIHITGNGHVLVRGAKVTAVNGSDIIATTAVGGTSLSWTVKTDSSTSFVHRFGGKSGLSEISVGDYLSFTGTVDPSATLTVKAKVVKDWSIAETHQTFSGTVKSIDSANSRFTLASQNSGDITVTVSSDTSLMKNGATMLFSVLAVENTARVTGVYNSDTHVLAASKISIGPLTAVDKDKESKKEDKDKEGKKDVRSFFKIIGERLHLNFSFR